MSTVKEKVFLSKNTFQLSVFDGFYATYCVRMNLCCVVLVYVRLTKLFSFYSLQ